MKSGRALTYQNKGIHFITHNLNGYLKKSIMWIKRSQIQKDTWYLNIPFIGNSLK